jgi:hypothetical protein
MSNKKSKAMIIPIILLTLFIYTGFSVNHNHTSLKSPELQMPIGKLISSWMPITRQIGIIKSMLMETIPCILVKI